MSVKYGKFELPNRISLDEETATPTFARFIAEPFERGFGHTIGNSMRRMMLSSLEAPAIISIRIEGVPHEYMPIDGIVEDMVNIVLNLKGALLRKLPMDNQEFSRTTRFISSTIDVTQDELDRNKGEKKITLADIIPEGTFEVVNPELRLMTITKPMKKRIDLRISFGRGYVPSERHIMRDKTADEILIDASFSPVRLVNYFVENTRVGQDTDFDRLILEVTTDGRITPTEAISFASQIGLKHFEVFTNVQEQLLSFEEVGAEGLGGADEIIDKLCLRIDEIELSVRSTNCLSGANIETIAELVSIPERKMLEFKNFGKKSLNEIKEKLQELGLHLGMDLARYGISQDNVKERVKDLQEEKKKRKQQTKEEE